MTYSRRQLAYFAHRLTLRGAADLMDRMAGVLLDAQVDLNPHQVDAAMFATSKPLAKGAILADEVGLGKTIETGLLLAQRWAERRRRLLVIVPANLRASGAMTTTARTSRTCQPQAARRSGMLAPRRRKVGSSTNRARR